MITFQRSVHFVIYVLVFYVKLRFKTFCSSRQYSEVCVELPVTLMHSKPVDAEPSSSAMSPNKSDENKAEGESKSEESSSSIDHNLISFDAKYVRFSVSSCAFTASMVFFKQFQIF